MNAIQKLSNIALAYVLNDFLSTDCWTELQVVEWRAEYLDRDYLPGIRTDEHGKDFPCIEGEEHNNLDFLWFVERNYSEMDFQFDDMGLLSNFCSFFIGAGLDWLELDIMLYNGIAGEPPEENVLQHFTYKLIGAEEYNALEDFVTALWNIYGDQGLCPQLRIQVTQTMGDPGWFFKA